MAPSELTQAATDFAAQLGAAVPIVEIEEIAGGAAMLATTGGGESLSAAAFHWRQRPSVGALVVGAQLPPVQGRLRKRDGRRLSQGRLGIDIKVAVVRMLLAKVVAGLRLGLTPGENLLQLLDQLLQVLAGKFPTEPKYQSWYAAHGGESLGNRAGSWKGDLQNLPRETSPPFLFPVKCDGGSSALKPECGKPSRLTNGRRLTTPAGGRKQKCQFPPPIQENIGLEKESF
jgi:hypothetical protein